MCVEDRALAAGHDAEALFEAPDPTGDACIDIVQSAFSDGFAAAHRVLHVAVAAVDDDIVLGQ